MDWLIQVITGLTILSGSIIALILSILKGRQEIVDNLPRKIKKQSNIDVGIVQNMENLKEFLNADRVQLFDFHNGGHYANGRSALKTTCTYEVVRNGIMSTQRLLRDIPLSCISKFTAELLDEGFVEVCDIEKIKDKMPATYQLKKDMGVTSFYDIVITNTYKEVIGFLAIQYVKNNFGCSSKECKQEILKLKFYIEEELAKTETK